MQEGVSTLGGYPVGGPEFTAVAVNLLLILCLPDTNKEMAENPAYNRYTNVKTG
jgi:hypothetical protein